MRWTISDRNFYLVAHFIFGPVATISSILCYLFEIDFNNNKESDW